MNKGFKLPCYLTDVPESDWMLKFVRNQLKGDPTKKVPKCTLTTPSERETKMSSSKFQLLSKLKALIECENVNGMQQEARTQDLCLFEARHVSTHLILKMSMHHIFSTNISASSSRMDSNSSSMFAAGTCLPVLLTMQSTSVISSPKNPDFPWDPWCFLWSSCCSSTKFQTLLVSILKLKKEQGTST